MVSDIKLLLTVSKRKFGRVFSLLSKGRFSEIMSRVRWNIISSGKTHASDIADNPEALVFESIEFVVTEKCTLKCGACSNLMQYYHSPKDFDLDGICRDIDLVMGKVDYIQVIAILGGEPFLFKELHLLLRYLAKWSEKYGLVKIVTNGTIVPNRETLDAIKETGSVVSVSSYGVHSVRFDELIKELKRRDILFNTINITWFAQQQLVDGSKRSSKEGMETYQKCVGTCNTVINGKLFHCPFLGHGNTLGAFPPDASNYVDLMDTSATKESIRLYKSKHSIPPGCRYCSGFHYNLPVVPTAKQIKEPLPYLMFAENQSVEGKRRH